MGQRSLDHQADAGLFQQQPQGGEHHQRHTHGEKPVGRELGAEYRERRKIQPFGLAVVHGRASPDELDHFQDQVAQPERDQQLRHMAEMVNPAQAVFLKQRAQDAHRERRDDQPGEIADRLADGVAQVSTDHVKACMREIEHAHHAEDQRQAGAEHEQQQAVAEAVEQGNGDEFHEPSSDPKKRGTGCPIWSLRRGGEALAAAGQGRFIWHDVGVEAT